AVCRRLDGIPLAIELAAARTSVLAPAEVAERLRDRFRLLTGGSSARLPRHRTLRALIEWSYELADDRERILLARAGVFSGGFSLEAAEEICSGEVVTSEEILDIIAELVDQSLIVVEDRSGRTRYGMLETIAAFAAERL